MNRISLNGKFISRTGAILFCAAVLSTSISCGETKKEKKTVLSIGTEGTAPLFSYTDESGNLTGFEPELIRALDARLENVDLKIEVTDWDSMFVGLESGKIDAITSQVSKTPDREKKYLFSEDPWLFTNVGIVFKAGRDDIHSMHDLEGKKVLGNYVSTYTDYVREYNRTHGDTIELGYIEGVSEIFFTEIVVGHYDAAVDIPFSIMEYQRRGWPLDFVPIEGYPTKKIHILFADTPKVRLVKPDIDRALRELRDDGTLSRLSIQFLGEDFTRSPAE